MRIYKGDVGTKIQLDAGEDISGAGKAELKFRKPDGTEGSFTATISTQYAYYITTEVSDLNVVGKWDFQLFVSDLNSWSGYGEVTSFYVWEKLQDLDIGNGYCNLDDVQRLCKRVVFGSTTKVTLEDVKDLIEYRYHEINGVLSSAGINVPVTFAAPVSIRVVRRLNALGAAGDAESIPTMMASGKQSEIGKIFLGEYNRKLEDLRNNPKMLYDAKQVQNRLACSTEDQDSSKVPFPYAKEEEFVADHKMNFGGDYSVDSGVKYFQGP